MTEIVHLDATILRPPVRRTDNGGRTYGMTTAVVGRGETAEFWKILVFGAKAENFLTLRNGDEISVAGSMRAELAGPVDAPTGVQLSMVADRLVRRGERGPARNSRRRRA